VNRSQWLIVNATVHSYGWLYSLAARELRRNDAISKSPMYSLYNETISGVAVIRAFGLSSKVRGDQAHQAQYRLRLMGNVSFLPLISS
jgi:hypothetical protein